MPDDETVNQMLARTEEEFEIYQVHINIRINLRAIRKEYARVTL